MSFLAATVSDYFAATNLTQSTIERLAGLPRMSVGCIINGQHPRPERFGQLLSVLPVDVAEEWLLAYLKDEIPEEWRERVEVIFKRPDGLVMNEQPVEYRKPPTLRAVDRLRAAMASDPELGAWFVRSVELILGPEATEA